MTGPETAVDSPVDGERDGGRSRWVDPGKLFGRIRHRFGVELRAHRQSIAVAVSVSAVCALVHWLNMDGWPGRINEDEGTYAAQAYAMQHWGRIAHYNYWYDHPFGGWLQIAAYTTVTGAFERTPTAVAAAREFMLWVHLASGLLVYALARRLHLRRSFAVVAVGLFSLSPLAVWYQRMVFLDNISIMWALVALVAAASPRKGISPAVWAGTALAFSFWSKETAVLFLPGVCLLLWQRRVPATRRRALLLFLGVFAGVAGLFVVYAAVRGELYGRSGSLVWAIQWQLSERESSGSLLQTDSTTWYFVRYWLDRDPYVVVGGLVAAVPAILIGRLRAVAVILLTHVAFMFRDGYTPYSYVSAMLPFAALCIAGLLDSACPSRTSERSSFSRPRLVLVGVVGACALVVLPVRWGPALGEAMTVDASRPNREATRWFLDNVPPNQVTITDDYAWLDLLRGGVTPDPIWHWKINDPAVQARLPNGWRDVDYVFVAHPAMVQPFTLKYLTLLDEALRHAVVVKSFGDGEAVIYKVVE